MSQDRTVKGSGGFGASKQGKVSMDPSSTSHVLKINRAMHFPSKSNSMNAARPQEDNTIVIQEKEQESVRIKLTIGTKVSATSQANDHLRTNLQSGVSPLVTNQKDMAQEQAPPGANPLNV